MGLAAAYLVVVVVLAFVEWKHGTACPWYVNMLFFTPVGVLLTLAVRPASVAHRRGVRRARCRVDRGGPSDLDA